MKLQKLKIVNYKNLKSMDETFNGNVFIVRGDNEKGKTTFCRSFLKLITKIDKPEVPVTMGEAYGSIEGVFTDANGNKYTVILDFSNDRETIRMIVPDGISTTKVSDIRSLFDYKYIDVDEFISWSATAEGRRKQRDVVLGLLKDEIKNEFLELEVEEKSVYEKRREANRSTEFLRNAYENSILEDESVLVIHNRDAIEAEYNKWKELNDSIGQVAGKIEAIDTKIKHLEDDIVDCDRAINESIDNEKAQCSQIANEIEELERQIKIKKEQLDTVKTKEEEIRNNNKSLKETYENEIEDLVKQKNELPGGDIKEVREKFKMADHDYDKLKEILRKKDDMDENKAKYDEAARQASNLDTRIDEIRTSKEKIIAESNLPIPGLSIAEDGITLHGLPFTKEQLSTSQIMIVVFQIMSALNEKTPIFYLGRSESLGKDKLDTIVGIATKNDYQVFIDRVESGEDLKIELYEDVDNPLQKTLL